MTTICYLLFGVLLASVCSSNCNDYWILKGFMPPQGLMAGSINSSDHSQAVLFIVGNVL